MDLIVPSEIRQAQGMFPPVSVIIVTYNSEPDIAACLESVMDQAYQPREVLVVDNGSKDRTVYVVGEKFPSVHILEAGWNQGAGKAFNMGIKASGGKYAVLLNPDTVVAPGWLGELVDIMERDSTVAACQSRLVLYDQPDALNAEGIDLNYLGFAWCRNYGQPASTDGQVLDTTALSGCSTILRIEALDKTGLFDEDFFMYMEDADLSLRIRAHGYRIVCNPKSVVYHKYKFNRGHAKLYYLERNRLAMMLKNYATVDLIKVLPAMVFMEAGLVGLSIVQGWFPQKMKAYLDVLRGASSIRAKRRSGTQMPGSVFRIMSPVISFEEVRNPLLDKLVNPLLGAYYRWVLCR